MADRYLLETSAVDGYRLEDGSGVLLLDGNTVYTQTLTASLFATSTADYASTVFADSPAGHWRLGEKSLTAVIDCGFEDAAVTTHWTRGGTPTSVLDSTVSGRTGTNACRFDIANTTALDYINLTTGFGGNQAASVVSFRFRISAFPTGDFTILTLNGVTYYNVVVSVDAAGSLAYNIGGTWAQGPTISTGVWYTVELVTDATNKIGHWKVDGVAQSDPGSPANSDAMNGLLFGKMGASALGALSLWVDDIVLSHTLADYPMSPGYVNTSDAWVVPADNAEGTAGRDGAYGGTVTYGAAGALAGDSDTAISLVSTGWVTIPDLAAWSFGDVFSVEFWFKQSGNYWQNVAVKDGHWGVDINNGVIEFYVESTKVAHTAAIYGDGNWHHLVATKNGAARSIYIDGSDVAILDTNLTASNSGNPIYIGGPGSGDFRGSLDEVAVYATALSAARVAAHYAAGTGAGGAAAGSLSMLKIALRTLTGGLTFAGGVARRTGRALAGGLTPAGSTLKRPARALGGGLTFAGATTKRPAKAFAGGLTFAGSVVRRAGKALAAGLTFSGAYAAQTSRALTGALTFAGATAKRPARALAGGLSFSGSIVRRAGKALSGALSFAGNVATQWTGGAQQYTSDLFAALSFSGSAVRSVRRSLTGGLTSSGALGKQARRLLPAGLAPAGALGTVASLHQALAGGLSFAGSAVKQPRRTLSAGLAFAGAATRRTGKTLTGGLPFSGATTRLASRSLAAALSFTGAMSTAKVFVRLLTGGLTFAGAQTRRAGKALSGGLSFAGAQTSRRTAYVLGAALTFSGSVTRQARRALAGGLSFSGAMSTTKVFLRTLSASLTFAGSQTRRAGKAFSGGLTFVGDEVEKQVRRALPGGLTFAGSVSKRPGKVVAGALTFTGTQARRTGKALSGSLSPAGALGRTLSLVRVLTASLTPSGALNALKTGMSQVNLTAALTFAGAQTRQTRRALAASLSLSGAISRVATLLRSLTASLTPAGSLQKRLGRPLAGVLTLGGGMTRRTLRSLSAALGLAGAVSSRSNVIEVALTATLALAGSMTKWTRRTLVATLFPRSLLDRTKSRLRGLFGLRGRGTSDTRTRAGAMVTTLRQGDATHNEIQQVVIFATGGTWTLLVGGTPTGALAWNASAADVEAAIEVLRACSVTKVGNVYTVEMNGPAGLTNWPEMTVDESSLTVEGSDLRSSGAQSVRDRGSSTGRDRSA